MKIKTKLCYLRALAMALPKKEISSHPALSGIHLGDHETLVAMDGKAMILVDVQPELRDTVTPADFTFAVNTLAHPQTLGETIAYIDTSSRILNIDQQRGKRITTQLTLLPHKYPDWRKIWSNATRLAAHAPMNEEIILNMLQVYRIGQALGAEEKACRIKYRGDDRPLEIRWDGFPDLRMIVAPFK